MSHTNKSSSVSVSSGIGLGTIGAAVLSWITWHSVPWAILHAVLGWFYIIYWMICYWK